MYLQANDCNPNTGKCGIYRYSMINNSFVELGSVYTFDPRASSVTPWKGAGAGLDLYIDGLTEEAYLIAVFYRYTNQGISYTYGPSTVVKYKISDGFISTHVANPNVNGVVVEGEKVYVTSFGGPQVAMGSGSSKIEMFHHYAEDIDFEWQFDINALNGVEYEEDDVTPHVNFGGDIVDIAFKAGKAYIYLAHYDEEYDYYRYRIICVNKASLEARNLNGAKAAKEQEARPASPCFGFLQGEGDKLYFVDGVHIREIDTSVESNEFGQEALGNSDGIISANHFTKGTDMATVINTAAIVIDRSVARTAGNGVRASVTRMAKRLVRPDELERRE